VLGSAAPPLTVKLVRAFSTGAKDSAIIDSKVSDVSLTSFEI
jgi:oligosaccharyltransferase complex subunit delta (ribophorin II)